MITAHDISPSEFILLHFQKSENQLNIGSTILFDKWADYKDIPSEQFSNYLNDKYLVKTDDMGSVIWYKILGYRES